MNNTSYALVTGASSGIGAEIAKILAARGHNLILTARREERLQALRASIQGSHQVEIEIITQDLSAEGSAQALYGSATSFGKPISILVNNAGFGMQGPFLEMDMDRLRMMHQLNMFSLTHLTQLFANDMIAQGSGHIMQVASASAFLPAPLVSSYAATKAYVGNFSEALTFELKGTGVSITTVYPGITATEFNAVAHAKLPKVLQRMEMTAEKVAQIGVKAMFKRKRAVTPGFTNKLNAWFSNVLPRGLVIRMAGGLLAKGDSGK